MIHVCLTHDIDRIDKTYQYVTKPLRALKNGKVPLFFKLIWSALKVRHPYWGFDKIMQIERQYSVRSTCFFLNESIVFKLTKPKNWKLSLGRYNIYDKRIVKIVKELDAGGWEIGVHGSYNSYNNYNLLKHEKEVLEKIVSHKVIGIRQHYLNYDDSTFEIQKKAGFLYDSTWGFSNGIGFKEGHVKPFFPFECSDYCEIPMTIMDAPFASTPHCWEEFEKIVEEIDINDAYLVINYHNNNFSDSDLLGYEKDYINMINVLKRLDAQFLTMGEAYRRILKTIDKHKEISSEQTSKNI